MNHATSARLMDEGSRYDRWESTVAFECARLNALAAALFENLDEDHENQIRDAIYDAALKIADTNLYPPNRHARRRIGTA